MSDVWLEWPRMALNIWETTQHTVKKVNNMPRSAASSIKVLNHATECSKAWLYILVAAKLVLWVLQCCMEEMVPKVDSEVLLEVLLSYLLLK